LHQTSQLDSQERKGMRCRESGNGGSDERGHLRPGTRRPGTCEKIQSSGLRLPLSSKCRVTSSGLEPLFWPYDMTEFSDTASFCYSVIIFLWFLLVFLNL
jgi:hypothetical protein